MFYNLSFSQQCKQKCKSANLLMHYQPVNALDAGDMGLLRAESPRVLVARPLGLLSLVPVFPPKVRFSPNRSAELVLLLNRLKKQCVSLMQLEFVLEMLIEIFPVFTDLSI